jgi:hypothetical protein
MVNYLFWYPSAQLLQNCLPLSMVLNKLLQAPINIVSLSKDQIVSSGIVHFRYCICITENRHVFSCAYTVSAFHLISFLICDLGPL